MAFSQIQKGFLNHRRVFDNVLKQSAGLVISAKRHAAQPEHVQGWIIDVMLLEIADIGVMRLLNLSIQLHRNDGVKAFASRRAALHPVSSHAITGHLVHFHAYLFT